MTSSHRMIPKLRLGSRLQAALLAHARADAPRECCGLVAGRGEMAMLHWPMRNVLASPNAFAADPADLFQAFRQLRRDGLDLLAIYHSHPASAAIPSRRDLAEWHYTDAIMLIISLAPVEEIRGWRLQGQTWQAVSLDMG